MSETSKPVQALSDTLSDEEQAIAEAEKAVRNIRKIAEAAENTADYKRSLDLFKQLAAMEQQLAEETRVHELAMLEKANQLEVQEREVLLLKKNEEIKVLELKQSRTELKKQMAFKRNLILGLILAAAIVLALYFLYSSKKTRP